MRDPTLHYIAALQCNTQGNTTDNTGQDKDNIPDKHKTRRDKGGIQKTIQGQDKTIYRTNTRQDNTKRLVESTLFLGLQLEASPAFPRWG